MTPDKEVIAYCRIGERSSHTWFVLKYLLGYPDVRNDDGSWTEWGNLTRTTIGEEWACSSLPQTPGVIVRDARAREHFKAAAALRGADGPPPAEGAPVH